MLTVHWDYSRTVSVPVHGKSGAGAPQLNLYGSTRDRQDFCPVLCYNTRGSQNGYSPETLSSEKDP